ADGAGYLLGYITCAYRAQYQPVLVKALKDSNPKVRNAAAQTLEKIQAADAVPDLIELLDDPDRDVQIRAAYALGGMGKAASSAEPVGAKLRSARVRRRTRWLRARSTWRATRSQASAPRSVTPVPS